MKNWWVALTAGGKNLAGVNIQRGACGVTVTVVGNGHGDTGLNPGRDWLHFT